MKKSVSRIVVVIAALAALLSVFGAAEAQGQDYPPTAPSDYEPPTDTANAAAFGFGGATAEPSADGNTGTVYGATSTDGTVGGTGGGLAYTGAETDVPAAIAIGLLAIGGTALVASRKRDEV